MSDPSRANDPVATSIRSRLTPEQFAVTQEGGTEAAFSGCYWDHKADGLYRCVVCQSELFASGTKFDSGSGWPSFTKAMASDRVQEVRDTSHGMVRIEVRCAKCDAHLGHVFDDGPPPTGSRFCINSAALEFEAIADE